MDDTARSIVAGRYVERLPWDSEFFAVPIGSAKPAQLDEDVVKSLLAEAEALGLACVYFRAAADDFTTISTAERHGFHLVAVRVVLERTPVSLIATAPASPSDAGIGVAREGDMPRLQEIAAGIAPRSRFAADPKFGLAEGVRLYRQWIVNAARGFADTILVTRDTQDGEATGLVTCTLHDGVAAIQLIGVDSRARRRGVGGSLFRGAIAWATERDARSIRIVTQAPNLSAQRLAQRFGFLTGDVTLFYHRWLALPRSST